MLNLNVCKECIGKHHKNSGDGQLCHFIVSRRQVSDENNSYCYKIFAKFVKPSKGYYSYFKGCEMNYSGDITKVIKLFSKVRANPNTTFTVPKNQEKFFIEHCEPTTECCMYTEHLINNLNSKKNENEH